MFCWHKWTKWESARLDIGRARDICGQVRLCEKCGKKKYRVLTVSGLGWDSADTLCKEIDKDAGS